jgi:hypothetical protein
MFFDDGDPATGIVSTSDSTTASPLDVEEEDNDIRYRWRGQAVCLMLARVISVAMVASARGVRKKSDHGESRVKIEP